MNKSTIGVNGSVNDNSRKETTAAPTVEKVKGWWASLPDESKTIAVIGVTVFGVFAGLMAIGTVTDSIKASNHRKMINSPGFKDMLERGLLDPVEPPPPPATLEEAAARLVLENAQKPVIVYDPYMAA